MDVLRDCCVYIFAHEDTEVISEIDVNKFKYMYVGYTKDFDRRMKEHLRYAFNPNYRWSRKFYNRLCAHGWEAYTKIIIASGLTEKEAKALEIETIAKYRTFELGLNSTQGGDGGACGADNPMAQAVNVYNNATGEIQSFMWIGAAFEFLGISTNTTIGQVANPTLTSREQTWSEKEGAWFQIKKAYDETPFIENMPTPWEKRAKERRTKIIVFNIDTLVETEYDGISVAERQLGIPGHISVMLRRGDAYFSLPNGERCDAQTYPKSREWKTNMLTRSQASGLAREKGVVAYDENDEFVFRFDSARKAGIAEKIYESCISKCAQHDPGYSYAGKKDGHKLRWEYEDPDERAFYDYTRPRNVEKPDTLYYEKDGKRIGFKIQKDAITATRGKYSNSTQKQSILKSIRSNGTIPCHAGYFWYRT